jgi:hypothetical protein
MQEKAPLDYGTCGLTIQYAFLDHVKRFPDKTTRPSCIYWNGLRIKTSDLLVVPEQGVVEAEFLFSMGEIQQGFDLKVNGWFRLKAGDRVSILRTWKDDRYEDRVQYPFFSSDHKLWVWNVYKMRYPGGKEVEEKWTENAGFWVEEISALERVYHCSHGMANPPDFESLVFRVVIRPESDMASAS